MFRTKRRNRKFRNKERLATRHKYGETFQSGGVRGLDNFLKGIPDAGRILTRGTPEYRSGVCVEESNRRNGPIKNPRGRNEQHGAHKTEMNTDRESKQTVWLCWWMIISTVECQNVNC